MKKSKIVLIVIAAILVVAIVAGVIAYNVKSTQKDLIFDIAGEYASETVEATATVEMTGDDSIKVTFSDGSASFELKHVTKSIVYIFNGMIESLSEGDETFMIFSPDGKEIEDNGEGTVLVFHNSVSEGYKSFTRTINGEDGEEITQDFKLK